MEDDKSNYLPTPIYNHVYKYTDVYEPAEDTFVFLDALMCDKELIQARTPEIVLEIGSGSGLVSAFIAQIIGKSSLYLCVDKNPSATLCTKETGELNSVNLVSITTDFVDSLLPRLKHQVDVLLFNPPYVVTPSVEITQGGIAYAWAGGIDGREVMDRFFPLVQELLSPTGLFYLVVVKENNPQEIIKDFEKLGFTGRIVKTRKAGLETLSVLRFER